MPTPTENKTAQAHILAYRRSDGRLCPRLETARVICKSSSFANNE